MTGKTQIRRSYLRKSILGGKGITKRRRLGGVLMGVKTDLRLIIITVVVLLQVLLASHLRGDHDLALQGSSHTGLPYQAGHKEEEALRCRRSRRIIHTHQSRRRTGAAEAEEALTSRRGGGR